MNDDLPHPRERTVKSRDGVWIIRELDARSHPGTRGPMCLICESGAVVRRFWTYPANWMTMPESELLAFCGPTAPS